MRGSAVLVSLCLLSIVYAVPNFIILMADDVGYGDLSCYGSPTIKTPNLDQLAQEGIRFTQWYAPAAICTPSRGATLTGRLPARIGFYSRFNYPFDYLFRVFYPSSIGGLLANETTIASSLKSKGYYSGYVGKWHLGHNGSLPVHRGFDSFLGTPYSHDEGYPGPFPMALVWPPVPLYDGERIIEQPIDLETLTPQMTERALDIIEQNAASNRPFFLYMSYHEAHIPLFVSEKFAGVSRRGLYGDMMVQMDDSISQIISKLKELQIDNNTLVLFLSDNGAWPDAKEPFTLPEDTHGHGGSNGPFREGKGSTWEGGIRGPAIAWWPGTIKPNQINLEIASHMDIFPTFMELAGIPLPTDRVIDGRSIVSLLTNEDATTPHEFFFIWREQLLMAVRYGPFKLHFATRSGFGFDMPVFYDPPLLFNVEMDPGESSPLPTNGSYSSIVQTIIAAAEAHKRQLEWGPPQYDMKHDGPVPGQDWKLIPCCKRQLNEEGSEFEHLTAPPDNWPLIVWRDCICPRFPKDEARVVAQAIFEPEDRLLQTRFFGHQLIDYKELVTHLPEHY